MRKVVFSTLLARLYIRVTVSRVQLEKERSSPGYRSAAADCLRNEIVALTFSGVLSDGGVTIRPARDANVERAHIGGGLCAAGVDEAAAF